MRMAGLLNHMAEKPISGSELESPSEASNEKVPTPKSAPNTDDSVEIVTYKVGPMPFMPPLPPAPYPYKRPYVFTDGTVGFADGFLRAVELHNFERVGLARKVPYGISFETNDQKLWLLGRSAFAPPFTHDVSKISGKIDVDEILNAEARSTRLER
jgi:hypothetical protein